MAHPEFEVTASIPAEDDYRKGNAERWSEVVLEISRDGNTTHRLDLTRSAGEAVIATLGDVLHRWAGKSIIDHIWEELDVTMDELMGGNYPDSEDRGYARGLATALAYMYNPINPDVEQIRADAVERWEERRDADVPFG